MPRLSRVDPDARSPESLDGTDCAPENVRVLKGKTALIAGATSGIGLSIAEGLGAQDTNLVINGFGDAAEIALGAR